MTPGRISAVRNLISDLSLDALLVTEPGNVRWASGFTGSNGALLIAADQVLLFTDGRYAIQAVRESPGCVVKVSNVSVVKQAAEFAPDPYRRVGYEADHLTVESFNHLQSLAPGAELVSTSGLIAELRYFKDENEINAIRQAARITDDAFSRLTDLIKPGITEKQLARELEYTLLGCGADKVSFDSIVASGPNAALVHAKPTNDPIRPNAPLLLDFGGMWGGYAADITRTLFLGQPDEAFISRYELVLKAQLAAIEAIRPGAAGADVDAVARGIIAEAGYGDNFGHSLGHSLGLDVHDGPALSANSTVVLKPGMVVTVEPGIYIEGWGGIRIEDDVLVTDTGCEVLTSSPKRLEG